MKVPNAVRAQAERAEQILKELEADESLNTTVTPEPEPVVETTPEPPPTPAPSPEEKKVDHRIKTIQGMWDADKRKFQEQINHLNARLTLATEELKATKTDVPEKYDIRKYLTQSQIDTYGEDLGNIIVQTAGQLVSEQTNSRVNEAVESRMAKVESKLQEAEAANLNREKELFWQTFAAGVPDWVDVNQDPAFLEWLTTENDVTGIMPQTVLTEAEQNFNAVRAIAIFNAYKKTKATVNQTPRRDPATKVIPESSPSTPTASDDTYMSSSEIRKFYSDQIRGAYKSKPEAERRMEEKINKAIAEGKIR